MKSKKIIMLIFLSFSLLHCGIISNPEISDNNDNYKEILFFDSFDDGIIMDDGWIDADLFITYNVSTDNGVGGTLYSCNLIGGNGITNKNGIKISLDKIRPETINFYAKSHSESLKDTYFHLINSSGATGIVVFFDSNGKISVNGNYCSDYSYDTWYYFELKNIDWKYYDFDVFVDRSLKLSSQNFLNNMSSFYELYLYNYDVGSESWFDEIKMKSDL